MNTITARTNRHQALFSLLSVKEFYSKFRLYFQNRRTRKHLAELSDHLLEDVGITRGQANEEVRKSFWE
ncbi:DUF1127 domain-containing protein [Vibrio cyclitrophicus]|uniref:DUF1127 domain-containing protein n=1 Tax=Vibrio cyclitrophicus TaxID=47951 RepID=UPI0003750528|nr:DUF1127 domain-containing protein [Vibrio cyclitrophicus]OED60975.1 hypothetical protein OAU_20945 [Vibrio cyclitrophicus ZF99]PME17396.1 hypothetical protein BCV43_13740 [Vibrio cyclitrophicus]PME72628.1 hypothetical protein BCV31_15225 [Vibrio cyclitrophicus]PMF41625.1 hypothetical protein BCV14_04800 [Vibrio cyclitrophicus]PMH24896.1 hypothetical protein BCU73_01100 [Vibrio cyclitrophicus]